MNKMIAIIMAVTSISQVSSAAPLKSGHYEGKNEQGGYCSMTIQNYYEFVWMTLSMESTFRVGDPAHDPIRVEEHDIKTDRNLVTYVGTNRSGTRYGRAQVYLNDDGSVNTVVMYKGKARVLGTEVRCTIERYVHLRSGI